MVGAVKREDSTHPHGVGQQAREDWPYSPWWRPASDAARQGCPAHLEGGTWSSANASTQTLRFKRKFKFTVGALTYIYTYKEGIASDGKTTLSGPELSVVASKSRRRDRHDTMQQPFHGCWRSGRDPWSTSKYGWKGGRWGTDSWRWSSSRWGETADRREWQCENGKGVWPHSSTKAAGSRWTTSAASLTWRVKEASTV